LIILHNDDLPVNNKHPIYFKACANINNRVSVQGFLHINTLFAPLKYTSLPAKDENLQPYFINLKLVKQIFREKVCTILGKYLRYLLQSLFRSTPLRKSDYNHYFFVLNTCLNKLFNIGLQ